MKICPIHGPNKSHTTLYKIYKEKKEKRVYNLFSKSRSSSIFLAESFGAGGFSLGLRRFETFG